MIVYKMYDGQQTLKPEQEREKTSMLISTVLPSILHILVGVQNVGHGRCGRVRERGQLINLRKRSTRCWKPTPHFTAIACTSRMHLMLQALRVDVEVVGRALTIVVGREANELLHLFSNIIFFVTVLSLIFNHLIYSLFLLKLV